jgi:hypothetical protein
MIEVNGLVQSGGPRQAVEFPSGPAEYRTFSVFLKPNYMHLCQSDKRIGIGDTSASLEDSEINLERMGGI